MILGNHLAKYPNQAAEIRHWPFNKKGLRHSLVAISGISFRKSHSEITPQHGPT